MKYLQSWILSGLVVVTCIGAVTAPQWFDELAIGDGLASPDGGGEWDRQGNLDTSGTVKARTKVETPRLDLTQGSYRLQLTVPSLASNRALTIPDKDGEVTVLGQTIELNTEVSGTLPSSAVGSGLTDAQVSDTLTVGSGGSVNDAALSVNIPRLNAVATISGDWVNTANPWADNEVSDTLTASIFAGSGSTTNAVDLATPEVAGTLPATSVGTGLTDAQVSNTLTLDATSSVADGAIPAGVTRDTEWDAWPEHPAVTGGYFIYGNASNQATAGAMGGDGSLNNLGQLTLIAGITRDTEWDAWAEHPAVTSGYILVGNASNQPAAVAMSGDVGLSNTGVATIQANSVALSADTTGNYVTSVGTGNGLTGGAAASEGATLTLSLNYYASSGDVSLNANEVAFTTAGIVAEGATADAIEKFFSFPADAGADQNWALPAGGGTLAVVPSYGYIPGIASSTNNGIPRWDGVSGALLKDGGQVNLGTEVTGTLPAASVGTGLTDAQVSDTITVGASGSVNDAAIPSGITRDTEHDTWAEQPALTSAQIVVGNGSNQPAAVTMSGDATLSNTGALSLAADSVGPNEIAHLGIEALTDPNAHRLMGWDDTDGAIKFLTLGTGLTYTPATDTLSVTGAGGTGTIWVTVDNLYPIDYGFYTASDALALVTGTLIKGFGCQDSVLDAVIGFVGMPGDYNAGNITVTLFWTTTSSSTTTGPAWGCLIGCFDGNTVDSSSISFADPDVAHVRSVSGGAKIINKVAFTATTPTNAGANKMLGVFLGRVGNQTTSPADDLTAAAYIVGARIDYTKS